MLDIKFIRENPKKVKDGCQKKQVKVDINRLLKIDKEKRETQTALESILAEKNRASRKIAAAKEKKEKQKIISEMQKLDKKSDKLKEFLKGLNEEFEKLICQIPNLPLDNVPVGKDEKDNIVLREIGKRPKFDFEPKDYLEIAEDLDLIDLKRAAKISGTRFGFLKREAALLEFALINLTFDNLIKKGFIPIIPPVMIKPTMMEGMGYLIKAPEEGYFIEKNNLYLVGTAEQSIGPMHANEIFNEKELPRRYLGFSTCFRREAGAYGKDTRGILRVHQFDKVEMFSFSKPDDSKKEHQFFLKIEEELMKKLALPYQVVQICTADMAFPTAAQYDIETWVPSQNCYRETHSTSNCTDFQARRLNIRYRDYDPPTTFSSPAYPKKEGKLKFVHTINGTAFAIGRTLIAIIENFQQKDGSIRIPEALQKYLPFKEIKNRDV